MLRRDLGTGTRPMPHVLYMEASPRKPRSASIEVAKAFLDA
ncbi:hypothetical protein [Methylobacterium sp.]|nr:hypothetical protein [Methylobacterium sp.]